MRIFSIEERRAIKNPSAPSGPIPLHNSGHSLFPGDLGHAAELPIHPGATQTTRQDILRRPGQRVGLGGALDQSQSL